MTEIYLVWAVGLPLFEPFLDYASAKTRAEAIVMEDGGRCVVIGPIMGIMFGEDAED
jgi:hypothetical protein